LPQDAAAQAAAKYGIAWLGLSSHAAAASGSGRLASIRQAAACAKPQGLGLALVVLTTAGFACITTFSKFAYAGGSNPQTLLLLRFAVFGVGMALVQRWRGCPLGLRRGMLGPILGVALFQLMLSGGYLGAVAFIPVGLAVILLYTSPFFVALLSVLMRRDRMTAIKAVAMALAFLGVFAAVGPSFAQLDPRGIVAGLTAALGLVLMITLGGGWMQREDPVALNMFAALLLVLPVAGYLASTGSLRLPQTALGELGLVGATVCFLLGTLCWALSMRLVAPIRMAVVLNLEMPMTIGIGTLFLGERLRPLQLAGAALVVGAVMALTLLGRRAKQGAPPAS
jgi:drug/metabolite transporter (DMT)-like permease